MVPIIAVQNGLSEISSFLEQHGYEVVSMEEYMDPVDAVVYTGVDEGWTGMYSFSNMGGNLNSGGTGGTVLVNAQGWTPEQVESMLASRVGVNNDF